MKLFPRARTALVVAGFGPAFLLCARLVAQTPASLAGQTLTLNAAIRRTLENNLDLQIRDRAPLIAQDALVRAQAEFDPGVFLEISKDASERQQNAIEFVSTGGIVPQQGRFTEDNVRTRIGLGGKLPTGAQYELSASLAELSNSINRDSPSAIFSPEYQSFAGVNLTQPLLQGAGPTAALAEVRLARTELRVSEYERELEITNKLIEVTNAYHDLVFGQENLRVKQEAVKIAEQLFDENTQRLNVGRMSQIDVAQAEVKLSEAREEELIARDFLRDRRVALLKLVSPAFDEPTLPDFAVDAAFSPDATVESIAALIARAHLTRPDYLLAQEEVSAAGLRRGQARNGALPKLDLQFSYGLNGLAESTRHSFNRVTDAGEPTWRAGLVLNVPLGNRAARAESRAAKHAEEQAELRLHQVEMTLNLDIHNAVNRLALQRRRVETAATSRRVAEAALAAENQRLEAGQTTSFNVLQLQDKVSSSRTRELAARVDLEKTLAEVWASSGQLFEKTGFVFARRSDATAGEGDFTLGATLHRE